VGDYVSVEYASACYNTKDGFLASIFSFYLYQVALECKDGLGTRRFSEEPGNTRERRQMRQQLPLLETEEDF
jgi:hypothetical protein